MARSSYISERQVRMQRSCPPTLVGQEDREVVTLKYKLKPEQARDAADMVTFENLRETRDYGILASPTGSGKTLTILSLILDNPTSRIPVSQGVFCDLLSSIGVLGSERGIFRIIHGYAFERRPMVSSSGELTGTLSSSLGLPQGAGGWNIMSQSLIVVPFKLMGQWKAEIQKTTHAIPLVISGKSQFPTPVAGEGVPGEGEEEEEVKSPIVPTSSRFGDAVFGSWQHSLSLHKRIVLCSSTAFSSLADYCIRKRISWQRVIFDEVDSIDLPNSRTPPASFYWFVTASFTNMQRIANKGFIYRALARTDLAELRRIAVGIHTQQDNNKKQQEIKTDAQKPPPYELYTIPCKMGREAALARHVLGRDHSLVKAIDSEDDRLVASHLSSAIVPHSAPLLMKLVSFFSRPQRGDAYRIHSTLAAYKCVETMDPVSCLSCDAVLDNEVYSSRTCLCAWPFCKECVPDVCITCSSICGKNVTKWSTPNAWRATKNENLKSRGILEFFDIIKASVADETVKWRQRVRYWLRPLISMNTFPTAEMTKDLLASGVSVPIRTVQRYAADACRFVGMIDDGENHHNDDEDGGDHQDEERDENKNKRRRKMTNKERKQELDSFELTTGAEVYTECNYPFLTPDASREMSKTRVCLDILHRERNKQTIVFINSNYVRGEFIKHLPESGQVTKRTASALKNAPFTWRVLQGSSIAAANAIRQFTNGELNVLIINGLTSGSGLNLQSADNIVIWNRTNDQLFMQMVARRQRPGCDLEVPLKVFELV